MTQLATCHVCGALALWDYGPSRRGEERHLCDHHVPRGCACNIIDFEDGEQHRDEYGRLLPCHDYWFYPEGFKP